MANTQPRLTAVPDPIPGSDLVRGLNELEAAVRSHMQFADIPTKTIIDIERDPTGKGLIVSFLVRGHDEARDAEFMLRRLPGYTVAHTSQSPSGMRRKVMGLIQ